MFLFEGDWGGEEEFEGEAGGMLRESVGAPSGRQRGLKETREASYERERERGRERKGEREEREGKNSLALFSTSTSSFSPLSSRPGARKGHPQSRHPPLFEHLQRTKK